MSRDVACVQSELGLQPMDAEGAAAARPTATGQSEGMDAYAGSDFDASW